MSCTSRSSPQRARAATTAIEMIDSGARVALVHGLWYGRPGMLPLAGRLKRRGWNCSLFGYSGVGRDPARNIARLRDWLAGLDAEPLHLVGHSLGGLLILKLLADADASLPTGRVVLLGSPLNGSAVARRMAANPISKPGVGRAAELLDSGIDRVPEGRETGMIAGTAPLGIGRLVARLDAPHDGTVSVSETRAPGLADHLELSVSHTGLVLSPRVADAVARFLRSGRFG